MKFIIISILTGVAAGAASAQDRTPLAPGRLPQPVVQWGDPDVMRDAVPVPAAIPDDAEPMLDFQRAALATPGAARFAGSLHRLSFAAGDYQPPAGQRIDPALQAVAGVAVVGEPLYAFVLLDGQDSASRMAALRAAGAEPIEFHPYSAYKVRLRAGAEHTVAALPFVRWVGLAPTWQKTSTELARVLDATQPAPAMVTGGGPGTLALYVTVFDSDLNPRSERFAVGAEPVGTQDARATVGRPWRVRSNGPHEAALRASGAQVAGYHDDCKAFLVFATPAQTRALVALNRVHYVEIARAIVLDHDQSTPLASQDEVREAYPGGGEVIAGEIDSGIDRTHRDLGFFGQGWDLTGDNTPWTDSDSHGTHVSGTILGRGLARIALRGNAPGLGWDGAHRFLNVRLYRGDGTAWGSALDAFDYMAAGGGGTPKAMVVNGSWHTSETGLGTDAVSVAADAKAYRDGILWVFAAGNRGSVGIGGINDPASAKNVLTIGNVYDLDWVDTGVPYDRGNAAVGKLSSTSSLGPAMDLRYKPNLSAPGHWITSTQNGSQSGYLAKSGTSMAAPHVTGIAASLMQHYTSLQGRPWFLGAKLMANAIKRNGAFGIDINYGFGKVNAYRAHWSSNAPGGWIGGSGTATISPGVGGTVDTVVIPADCEAIRLVTWHIEGAASTGGGNAVKNNVDAYIDVPPYTNGTNTGEYSSRNVLDNLEQIEISGAGVVAARGQVLRIKLHPTSIRAGESVYVGYQYILMRGTSTPTTTVTATSDKRYVRPDEQFVITARIEPDTFFATNVLNRFSDPAPFTVQNMHLYLKDGVLVERLQPSNLWQTVGDVRYNSPREVRWQLKAPAADRADTTFRTTFYASNVQNGAALLAVSGPVCVDGSAPNRPANLDSATHPADRWTNATRFTAGWTHATDVGPAGVAGYSHLYALAAPPTPDAVPDTVANSFSMDVVSNVQAQYFAVRTVDNAGNVSTVETHRFYVDTSTPVFSAFSIDNGAAFTRSRLVDLQLTASDTFSGVAEMRFSSDGQAYGVWIPFRAQVVNFDLANPDSGSPDRGLRTLWCQVRDQAGNMPAARAARITWDDLPPTGDITLNAGGPWTTSTRVNIGVRFTDLHTRLVQMRFSNDGLAWSPFEAFVPNRPNWDLTAFGGNASPGRKTVWAEVEDEVGNRSAPVQASIELVVVPRLDAIAPTRTQSMRVPEEAITLTGDNHAFLTEAVLRRGTVALVVPLGTAWDVRGRLVDGASNLTSTLYLPKPIAAGQWTLHLRNPAGEGNGQVLTLDDPPRPGVLDVTPTVQVGHNLSIVSSSAAGGDLSFPYFSESNLPSSLPGIVDLAIGDGFRRLYALGSRSYVQGGWSLSVPIPNDVALDGLRLYFQSIQVDPLNAPPFPLPTTNAVSTVIRR